MKITIEKAVAQQAPIGYLAHRDGKPSWDDGCVCEDPVYPVDEDDDRVSVAIYTHPAQRLTDAEILANDTLRYYFGLNGGAGPVSGKGRKIVDAIMDVIGVKE